MPSPTGWCFRLTAFKFLELPKLKQHSIAGPARPSTGVQQSRWCASTGGIPKLNLKSAIQSTLQVERQHPEMTQIGSVRLRPWNARRIFTSSNHTKMEERFLGKGSFRNCRKSIPARLIFYPLSRRPGENTNLWMQCARICRIWSPNSKGKRLVALRSVP